MKTFTVELWAAQDQGHVESVTLPEDVNVDPDNRHTLHIVSRFLIKYTNGSRTPGSEYQKRPLLNGDVFRIGNRRFCIISGHIKNKDELHTWQNEYHVLELSKM